MAQQGFFFFVFFKSVHFEILVKVKSGPTQQLWCQEPESTVTLVDTGQK